jgi:tetratricopeptide (TPR) repeat protein
MHQVVWLAVVLVLAVGEASSPQRLTPAQHARAGWDALHAGRAQEASTAFAQALERTPQEPSVLLGAGLAAHLLGQSDAARRLLVDALNVQPSLLPASLLLGEVLYRADDLNGAIQVYEQALAHAPTHKALATRLDAWRREAALHQGFAQKLGDHFTVLFEGPAEAELAAKAVEVLEAAYWRIGSALYSYPTGVITVVLYTREQFRDVTQAPEWAGGLYDGRIRVPVLGAMKNRAEFERVLAHEFTHALVRNIAPRGVPQWLSEGLALSFEGRDLTAQLEHARAAPAPHALTRLERPFAGMDGKAAALAYAQSAAAVKRLLDDAGAPAVVGILEDLARGLPFAEAFERHAHMTYADFQKGRDP